MKISVPEQIIRCLIALLVIWKLPEVYWIGIVLGAIVLFWHGRKSKNIRAKEPIPDKKLQQT
jgi:hypothetical protein